MTNDNALDRMRTLRQRLETVIEIDDSDTNRILKGFLGRVRSEIVVAQKLGMNTRRGSMAGTDLDLLEREILRRYWQVVHRNRKKN